MNSSVAAVSEPVSPPNAKPAVCVPAPPVICLAVAMAVEVVQDVPFHTSVADEIVGPEAFPPNAKPKV